MKKLMLMITFLLSVFALSACDVNEGGPEEFGENIEETAEDIGNDIEDACEEVKEGVKAEDTDC
ncbi:hypothetical protein L1F30_02945 [Simiduia sp. 21SJ11W-1]|uniref:hypothetical protein n=1 Tax=Simiduia sp. 21SJ11W-1 TaxID=2909669 RepID=UPI00209E901E|nr:hypothetical protein [Simiduia sp. 21SJ11W-1]UTA48511.1 hypothetical protein L1F30_02945 [Simiduia sp. 21SJ11W-1]